MSDPGAARRWSDALAAARLFARDPAGFGGIVVRARAGPVRDAWLAQLKALLPAGMPALKLPANIEDERLTGGLDLVATLDGGKPVVRRGVLAEADGGVVIVPMAERMSDSVAGQLAAVLDTGVVVIERDGAGGRHQSQIGVVLLDEGVDEDERPPAGVIDRCAFLIDLDMLSVRDAQGGEHFDDVEAEGDALTALCEAAAMLGIDSARAPLFALRAYRAGDDIELAARLVLAPRATRFPAPEDQAQPPPEPPPEPEAQPDTPPDPAESSDSEAEQALSSLTDIAVEAARAALPPGLLLAMAAGQFERAARSKGRGSGAAVKAKHRGRPAGVRPGEPRGGAKLSLVETLRAAAPWQRLRQAAEGRSGIIVRQSDFRVKRFEARAESTSIFVVDASGSAALERLSEAKGAVELLLAEAYVKRTQVALIAFRGTTAEIVLPPTRSLARAKRCLAELSGGGGTPLAAGIEAGRVLAEATRGKGRTPFMVLMTDGRGNVSMDGTSVRAVAEEESFAAARQVLASGIGTVLIDISPRPRPEAAKLGAAMGARYVPLPRGQSGALRDVVSG